MIIAPRFYSFAAVRGVVASPEPSSSPSPRGRRDLTAFAGTGEGVEPWPHLALFGPVYSYGRGWKWGHGGPIWHSAHSYAVGQLALVVASFGLVRSSQERQTFNSVAFDCIRLHSLSPARGRDASLGVDRNDIYEQCSNQWGYGVRGSCRWFGVGEGHPISNHRRSDHPATRRSATVRFY